MAFTSFKKRIRKISNALITRAVLKDIEKNKMDLVKKKKTFISVVSNKTGELYSFFETISKTIARTAEEEERAQRELIAQELEKTQFNARMNMRYEYKPSIINHKEYLENKTAEKNKIINIKKHGDGFYTSNFMVKQIDNRNFESADRRFGGSKINETKGNVLHLYDFQPEIEMMKILGYLSEDEETLYPMLKTGDLLKVTAPIHMFDDKSNQNNMFGSHIGTYFGAPNLSGINTIQEEERRKNYIPLFRNLEPGDIVMFLGFKKFEDERKDSSKPGIIQGFFDSLASKLFPEMNAAKELPDPQITFRVKKSFIAEWIVDDKVVTAIFPITSLEKHEI